MKAELGRSGCFDSSLCWCGHRHKQRQSKPREGGRGKESASEADRQTKIVREL